MQGGIGVSLVTMASELYVIKYGVSDTVGAQQPIERGEGEDRRECLPSTKAASGAAFYVELTFRK
ncbi:MAG TPA: hypothetical protein VG323_20060 [Thermoanaerobaculia bacterium]|nr:hypothetical protein [Thermoanaerobaculia bacterium]